MGLYQPGPTASSQGGLDRPPGQSEPTVGGVASDMMHGVTKFISGNNDWTAPYPTIPSNPYGGASQYTEEDYQNALAIYNSMTPEQQQAAFGGHPPPAPELYGARANVNLQRTYTNPLLGQLQQAAAGEGPSQAQDTLRAGTARTVGSAYGMAQAPSVGGAQRAALLSQAGTTAAGAQQEGARQAAQLRAQEMTDARQQLGNTLAMQQGINTQQAGQQLEREKANQQGQIATNPLNQATGQQNRGGAGGFIGGILESISDIRAKEGIETLAPGSEDFYFKPTVGAVGPGYGGMGGPVQGSGGVQYPPVWTPPPEAAPAQTQQPKEEKSGFLSGLGNGLLSMSDERSKEKIRSLESALAESRRTSGTIASTAVQYPQLGEGYLNLAKVGPPTARFPDLRPEDEYRMKVGRALQDDQEFVRKYKEAQAAGWRALPEERVVPTARFADLATPQGSRQALAPVGAYQYSYKPEYAAALGEDTAPRAGIMAQDLERSPNPALRSAVVETPMGKAIDGKRALSANLALSAGLDKRLRNIEGALSQPTVYPTYR